MQFVRVTLLDKNYEKVDSILSKVDVDALNSLQADYDVRTRRYLTFESEIQPRIDLQSLFSKTLSEKDELSSKAFCRKDYMKRTNLIIADSLEPRFIVQFQLDRARYLEKYLDLIELSMMGKENFSMNEIMEKLSLVEGMNSMFKKYFLKEISEDGV